MKPPHTGVIHVHVAIQHARDSFRATPNELKAIYGPIPRWGTTSAPAIALKKATLDDNWNVWEKSIVWDSGEDEIIMYLLPKVLEKYIKGEPSIPFSFSFDPMVTAGRIR